MIGFLVISYCGDWYCGDWYCDDWYSGDNLHIGLATNHNSLITKSVGCAGRFRLAT